MAFLGVGLNIVIGEEKGGSNERARGLLGDRALVDVLAAGWTIVGMPKSAGSGVSDLGESSPPESETSGLCRPVGELGRETVSSNRNGMVCRVRLGFGGV